MESRQVFYFNYLYFAYGHLLYGGAGAGAGGGGGDDPNRPRQLKSAHEADDAAPPRRRRPGAGGEGPCACPICGVRFKCVKAVHGHMRSHPERLWRGMAAPRQPPPATEDDARRLPYLCDNCGLRFETRQALGGHRASHSGRKGCYRAGLDADDAAAAPAEPAKKLPLPFDLNEPAQEDDEE
ncbi:hypothetical protein ACP4OV_013626 [Aristida adscensionis]